jgi:predicted secreted hydrolase
MLARRRFLLATGLPLGLGYGGAWGLWTAAASTAAASTTAASTTAGATPTASPPDASATAALETAEPGGHSASATPGTPAAPAVVPRPLEFPRDHGAHLAYRIEWWYATGTLEAIDGTERFGFQLTFFRSRTDAGGASRGRFAPQQLLFAHAALTDLAAGRLLHAERIARWTGDPAAPLAAASLTDTAVHLGDWHFRRGDAQAWDGRMGGAGTNGTSDSTSTNPHLSTSNANLTVYDAQLGDRDAGFAYTLTLASTQPLLLQGDAGYSRKGPEPAQASHYYSQPQLAVAGTLRRDERVLAVRGTAWLDHEWSEALMHPAAVGWDWIGMNLDDGGALTAFRLRRADGTALWAGGSFRPRGGAVRAFGPDELQFVPLRHWRSPVSQGHYPVHWRIDTPAGRFEVVSLLDAQELDSRSATGSIYWEGLSELRAASGGRVGLGYLEMTGYVSPLRLG